MRSLDNLLISTYYILKIDFEQIKNYYADSSIYATIFNAA